MVSGYSKVKTPKSSKARRQTIGLPLKRTIAIGASPEFKEALKKAMEKGKEPK